MRSLQYVAAALADVFDVALRAGGGRCGFGGEEGAEALRELRVTEALGDADAHLAVTDRRARGSPSPTASAAR